ADDVADDHHEEAEVEQRAADAQQPRFVQLRGAGGPAELVVAVPPDRAEDQDRDHHVRQHAPQQDVEGAHRGPPGGKGASSSPTCSCGGPVRASARAPATSAGEGPGSSAHTASTGAAYAVRASRSASRSSSNPARCSCRTASPSARSAVAPYSSTAG